MSLKRVNFSPLHTFARATVKNVFQPEPDGFGGTDYILKEVASGAPAFAWNPETGESRGIYIEEARTNLFFSSSYFDSANWSKSASLVVSDVNSVIQGQTANRLTGGGVFEESVNQSKTITGTSATAYIIIESGTSAVSSLRLRDATASTNVGLIGIDWATEALITTSGTGKLTKLSNSSVNGGKLFLLEINASVTSGNLFVLNFFPNGVAPQGGVASTDNCIIHHAQLEAGSSASSPIVTAGTSITRLADVVTVPDLSGWFNASEGCITIRVSEIQGDGAFFVIDNGNSFTNSIYVRKSGDSNIALITYEGGAAQLVSLAGGYSNDAIIDVNYGGGEPMQIRSNGGAWSSLPSRTNVSGLTTFRVGRLSTGANNANGFINSITYQRSRKA